MLRARASGGLALVGVILLLAFPACGKKAPLRLSDDRVAERAPAVRARIRDGIVTLDFRVPGRRVFPEREEPWVFARVLRQSGPASDSVEVGTILNAGGFDFGSSLTWSDRGLPPKSSFVYRVEFRDAARRRRALTEPLTVSWERVPDAPLQLAAEGRLRSIVLTWEAPAGTAAGTAYTIYRREISQVPFEQAAHEPVGARVFTDTRIEPERDYCYVVRAIIAVKNLEIEGPASPESCARAAAGQRPAP